jgi:murein DD-endopeptidase MepM/ murein hydrolase activator NlpD
MVDRMSTNTCPRCKGAVAVLDGRPYITPRGVELWHPACWTVRDQPIVVDAVAIEAAAESPPVKRARYWMTGALALSLVGVALGRYAWAGGSNTALANVDLTSDEPIVMHGGLASNETVPPEPDLLERFPIATAKDGTPLPEKYPSLAAWTHPVSGAPELMTTTNRSRMFGSERHGIDRAECGSGHCGVDLDGPRGRPIVAVASGIVIRIERRELGADGRSGRYVRVMHDDGPLTAYMHMDEVADDLKIGDRVEAGRYLGTLGATAVFQAAPHLHFTLEVPRRYWERGDHIETTFLDPAPYLVRAKVLPAHESIKPAS